MYNGYGGTHRKPGDKMFMAVDEFENVLADAGLVSDSFGSRDINVCFNLSMMTQVNEIEKDRHLRMTFVEFLEAFARAADKISAPPQRKDPEEELMMEVCDIITVLY